MKKGIMHFLLGFISLFPLGLSANALANVNNCNLSAPENLHIVSSGSTWLQVAWNEVQGASIYRVTTRNEITDAILSDFFIDASQVTISNLPPNVPLKVSVLAVNEEQCSGPASYIISPPLGLVFDLVLGYTNDATVNNPCNQECAFTGAISSNPPPPSQPQFYCAIAGVPEQYYDPFEPYWLEIKVPENQVVPRTNPHLYLYIHPLYDPEEKSLCHVGCTIVDPYSGMPGLWNLSIDYSDLELVHITFGTENPT